MFQTYRICEPGGRSQNQDDANFLILDEPRAGCWILADGLGGHQGGEIASELAVDAVLDSFRHNPACTPEALERHFSAAQRAIVERQESDPELAAMRSTLVLLITDFDDFLWGYIGDSRLYYFQDNRIVVQTRDHSVPQAMVDSGQISVEQIRGHEDRNRLLRSLGNEHDFRPTISQQRRRWYRGDTLLMCSDGFWEFVYENEMEADITKAETPRDWLEHLEHRLLGRASGHFDNYSAIAVYFTSLNAPRPRPPRPRPTPPPLKSPKRKKKELSLTALAMTLVLLFTAGVMFLGYASYKTWFAGSEETGGEPGQLSAAPASAENAGVVWDTAARPRARQSEPVTGMPFVFIPPNLCVMGTGQSEDGQGNDETSREVEITHGLWMGQTEVTQAQYFQVVTDISSKGLCEECPVENVSWLDAVRFANTLSELSGAPRCYDIEGPNVGSVPDCYGFRLPTEAEWECAARAGNEDPFGVPGIDLAEEMLANRDGPVQDLANEGLEHPYGLVDILGNVSEWVWDWYGEYPSGIDVEKNPEGPETGGYRVYRGGNFDDTDLEGRHPARRSKKRPWGKEPWLGFRLVRTEAP